MRRWGASLLILVLAACATTQSARDREPDGPIVDPLVFQISNGIVQELAQLDQSCAVALRMGVLYFRQLDAGNVIDPVYTLRCERDDGGFVLKTEYMIRGLPRRQTTLVRMFGP